MEMGLEEPTTPEYDQASAEEPEEAGGEELELEF